MSVPTRSRTSATLADDVAEHQWAAPLPRGRSATAGRDRPTNGVTQLRPGPRSRRCCGCCSTKRLAKMGICDRVSHSTEHAGDLGTTRLIPRRAFAGASSKRPAGAAHHRSDSRRRRFGAAAPARRRERHADLRRACSGPEGAVIGVLERAPRVTAIGQSSHACASAPKTCATAKAGFDLALRERRARRQRRQVSCDSSIAIRITQPASAGNANAIVSARTLPERLRVGASRAGQITVPLG